MRAGWIGVAMIAFATQTAPPPPAPVKPGPGITEPRLLHNEAPKYTSAAMAAHIQGSVELEVVVRVDGTVGDVRVTKALDPGLDREAIAAAKLWRFRPGHDATGTPVPVLVTIILDFRLADEPPKVELRTPLPASLTRDFLQDARLFGAPGMIPPELLSVVQAEPTDMATMMKIQGSVDIDFVIGTDGTVARARVARSLDPLYGLDERAIAAVKKWKFKPARQSGEAVPVAVSVTLVFRAK
ncbi:MAG TPA: energy transducer TonB [Vicinamibacterales bacterium]|nr:energy transducer TonB [Vicinamibacterales bacterium]